MGWQEGRHSPSPPVALRALHDDAERVPSLQREVQASAAPVAVWVLCSDPSDPRWMEGTRDKIRYKPVSRGSQPRGQAAGYEVMTTQSDLGSGAQRERRAQGTFIPEDPETFLLPSLLLLSAVPWQGLPLMGTPSAPSPGGGDPAWPAEPTCSTLSRLSCYFTAATWTTCSFLCFSLCLGHPSFCFCRCPTCFAQFGSDVTSVEPSLRLPSLSGALTVCAPPPSFFLCLSFSCQMQSMTLGWSQPPPNPPAWCLWRQ